MGGESYNKEEQRKFGNSIVDEIRELWQEQGVKGKSLTLDMYLMMDDKIPKVTSRETTTKTCG